MAEGATAVDETSWWLWAWTVFRPLWPVWLLWVGLAVALPPRSPWAWGLAAVGLGVRLWAVDPGSPLPYDKGFGLFEEALGHVATPPWWADAYGDAWASAGSLVYGLTGDPDAGAWTALAASVLAIPWVVSLASRTGVSTPVAHIAGLAQALLPLSVALSQSVTRFSLAPVLVLTGLDAVRALDAPEPDRPRVQATMVWVSAALLAHTRPFLIFVAAGLLLLLARRRRWVAVAAGAVWLAMRVGAHLQSMPDLGEASGAKLDRAWIWWTSPSMWLDGPVALDPGITPWILPVLACVGAVAWSGTGRAEVVGSWVLATAPFVHFSYDFDLGRMQLASLPLVVVMAAHGLQVLTERWAQTPRWRQPAMGVALVAAAGSWWAARHPRGEPVWSWVVEDRLLRDGLRDCPRDRPIVYGPTRSKKRGAGWFGRRGHRRVVPETADVPPGTCRFVGLTAWEQDRPVLDGWRARDTATVALSSDGWYDNEGQRVTIGWYVREDAPQAQDAP